MILKSIVLSDEIDVKRELGKLGLSLEQVQDVLRHIALTINSQTPDHPIWGRGIATASEAVFALRNILKQDGWYKEENNGFALVVHPNDMLAINIAKGDDGTGDPNSEVRSVSEKGCCTESALEVNGQIIFQYGEKGLRPIKKKEGRPTWYLLYKKKVDGIHAELSFPMELADTGQLAGWSVRIILPVTKEDSGPEVTAGFEDGGFAVSIRRKSA